MTGSSSGPGLATDAWPIERRHLREVLQEMQPLDQLEWHLNPTQIALNGSTWRVDLPEPFCVELGRRILLAQLEFSEWVLRRVERVTFERDRSVSRTIEIDLLVRPDAPVFVDRQGNEHWLIPLSMMHRRTLVNFHVTDESANPITMPGIRLTQQLDQSVLLAAAAVEADEAVLRDRQLSEFVRDFIAGTKDVVHSRSASFLEPRQHESAPLGALVDNSLFVATVRRLRRTFSLFVFLPVESGRHRLLSMSFDEPTDWRYQRPSLKHEDDGVTYGAGDAGGRVSIFEPTHILAALALRPTRIRFQVPGAEHAASYHFEAISPLGIRIAEASLLAGRPNEPRREVSWDHVVGHAPKVGLHALEIPNGSLCRVQLDLAVPSRGWLATLLVASWLIVAVVLSAMYNWHNRMTPWQPDRVTNVVAILITTSAGAAALLAQREFGGVVARLVSRLRALAVIQIALPAIAAGFLAYGGPTRGDKISVDAALISISVVASVIALLISFAWLHSLRVERSTVRSPWDIASNDQLQEAPRGFVQGLNRFGFDSPAVGIRSAEAWHERYNWSDAKQVAAVTGLMERFGHHDAHSCRTHWNSHHLPTKSPLSVPKCEPSSTTSLRRHWVHRLTAWLGSKSALRVGSVEHNVVGLRRRPRGAAWCAPIDRAGREGGARTPPGR